MRLENERLCVEITELGAEILRVYDKKYGREVVWEADPAYWKRHAPVLFPNVGKTYRNTVLINGIHYPTSQHGFARDSMFKCTNSTRDSASFLLVSNEETKEVYPFDFELVITYTLKEKSLCVKWEVRNPGEEEMYFTIGGHPAFRFSKPEEKKTDYILKFPGKEKLRYVLIDPNEAAVDPADVHTIDLRRKQRSLISAGAGADLNDNVFVIIRVFRKKKDLQLLLQFLHTAPGLAELFLRQFPHLLVRLFLQHRKAVFYILTAVLIFFISFHDRSEIALLLHELPEPLGIVCHIRLLKLSHYFFISNQ